MDKELIVAWIESGQIHVPVTLLKMYRQLGLDEKELVLLLQILSFKEQGNEFPTPEQLAERMTITVKECSLKLRRLVQTNVIEIEEEIKEDIRFERYSLKPLWYRLVQEMIQEKKQVDVIQTIHDEQDIYTVFEQEFGRPLSPLECESLAMWIDQDGQDPALIKAALREAVLSGSVNFRYIDRILFEWKKNGVQTVEQAKTHSQRFRQKTKNSERATHSSNAVPFYNWLEQ